MDARLETQHLLGRESDLACRTVVNQSSRNTRNIRIQKHRIRPSHKCLSKKQNPHDTPSVATTHTGIRQSPCVMPTQRPFLSNFLAAFRSHTPQPLPKSVASLSTTSAAAASTSTQTVWTSQPTKPQSSNTSASENAVSHPRPINAKGQHHNAQSQQEKHGHPSLQHNVTPQTHLPLSPPTSGVPVHGPPNKPQPSYPTVQESRRARRGSDSSCDSGGFRDVRGGGEKWFIGGKTASGEERYYKLSMVRRDRSADRISTDQLSL